MPRADLHGPRRSGENVGPVLFALEPAPISALIERTVPLLSIQNGWPLTIPPGNGGGSPPTT
jgi:hypothetical protein